MKKSRKVTFIFLAISCLSLIAAFIVGISDNLPGLLLCYIASSAFILAIVHGWRKVWKYLVLLGGSVVGFGLGVLLHNFCYGLSKLTADIFVLHYLFEVLHVAFFLITVLVCPAGVLVGAAGSIITAIMKFKRNKVKKAVDVVLLPNEAMTDKAIEANAKLVAKFGSEIVLNKKDCLPHISLAMGCADEKDIDSVGEFLRTIAEKHSLGELTVKGIRTTVNSRGESVLLFEVEKTEELQQLHQEVMRELGPYLSYDVRSDMIYGDEDVSETALLWIANYRERASFDKFFPHITIGYGKPDNLSFSMKFTASKLALCHLGNHCTCRKILLSFDIKKG